MSQSHNPALIQRDGQILTVRFDRVVLLDEGDNVDDLIARGYHILRIPVSGQPPLMYRSIETDGYIRSMDDVDEWDSSLELFPYEKDHRVWENNVSRWFDMFSESPTAWVVAKKFGITVESVEELARLAKVYQSRFGYNSKRKTGRRGDLYNWFCVDKNCFVATRKFLFNQ